MIIKCHNIVLPITSNVCPFSSKIFHFIVSLVFLYIKQMGYSTSFLPFLQILPDTFTSLLYTYSKHLRGDAFIFSTIVFSPYFNPYSSIVVF